MTQAQKAPGQASKLEAVKALLAERRAAQQPSSIHTSTSDIKTRVQELLSQRKAGPANADAAVVGSGAAASRDAYKVSSPPGMYAGAKRHAPGRSSKLELLSPDSSVSFEFDRAAAGSNLQDMLRSSARMGRSISSPSRSPTSSPAHAPPARAVSARHDLAASGAGSVPAQHHIVREVYPSTHVPHASSPSPGRKGSNRSSQGGLHEPDGLAAMTMDDQHYTAEQWQLLDDIHEELRGGPAPMLRAQSGSGAATSPAARSPSASRGHASPQRHASSGSPARARSRAGSSSQASPGTQAAVAAAAAAAAACLPQGQHQQRYAQSGSHDSDATAAAVHQEQQCMAELLPHQQHQHQHQQLPHHEARGVHKQQPAPSASPAGSPGQPRSLRNTSSSHRMQAPPNPAAQLQTAAAPGRPMHGVAPAGGVSAEARAHGDAKPSLAELEQRLAQVMHGMSLAAAGGPSDGPFDISGLWAWAGDTSQPTSVTQSENSMAHDGGRSGQPEVTSYASQPQPQRRHSSAGRAHKQGKATSRAAATGATAAIGATVAAARAASASGGVGLRGAGQPAPPAAILRKPGAARARPQSAPRARVAAPAAAAAQEVQLGQVNLSSSIPPGGSWPEFSFQPRINESSRRMVIASYPQDREERLAQLSVPKAVMQHKYEQVRREVEAQQLAECTFTPRTGRPPSPAKARTGPVHERLYQQQPTWLHKRAEILEVRDQEVLQGCTFKPAVSKGTQRRAASAGRQPLHLRVPEVLRSRNEALSNTRIRLEVTEDGATFRPAVNQRSLQLAEQAQQAAGLAGLPAGERLYQEARQQQQHKHARAGEEEGGQACTFAPAINARSRALLAASQELPASFLQRQEYLARLAAEKRALYSRAVEAAQTGQGQGAGQRSQRVSPRSGGERSLAASGSWTSGELGSCSGDYVAKLAYADMRRSAALKDALSTHYYRQFSFAPDINPRSRVIGKAHSIEELHSNAPGAQARERVSQATRSQELEECTFRPALNPLSLKLAEIRRSTSLLDAPTAAVQALKTRDARLQEARALQQYEELRECTFTPEINRQPPANKGSVPLASLPGVNRYLDMKGLAKRKQEEMAKRQEKVWWQQPQGSVQPFTVPQPFSFEAREAQQEQERLMHEYERHAAAAAQEDARAAASVAARRRAAAVSRQAAAVQSALQQAEQMAAQQQQQQRPASAPRMVAAGRR